MKEITLWAESLGNNAYLPPDPAPLKRRHWYNLVLCAVASTAISAGTYILFFSPEPRKDTIHVVMLANTLADGHHDTGANVSRVKRGPPLKPAVKPPTKNPMGPRKSTDSRPVEQAPPPKLPIIASNNNADQGPGPAPIVTQESSGPKLPGNRAVNIASAAKFGLRQVSRDEVTLMNGVHVKLNGRFPNGEMLISVDAVKGVVETDRRTMVITPP